MDENERIRQRAHEIWEREGRPDGQSERHWREAASSLTAPTPKAAEKASAKKSEKPVKAEAKPAKKAEKKKAGDGKKADPAKKKAGGKAAKKAG